MTKLGIIGAMRIEVETLLEKMENVTMVKHAWSEYYEGTLEGLSVVVVQCGVGKVNAAMCAQILCSCYLLTWLHTIHHSKRSRRRFQLPSSFLPYRIRSNYGYRCYRYEAKEKGIIELMLKFKKHLL